MKVLIPIISRKEDDSDFIEKALSKASEVFVLVIIDPSLKLDDAGFTASNIAIARNISEKIKEIARQKRKTANELMEWGSTKSKVLQTARFANIDKIVLLKQENEFFNEIVNEIKNAGFNLEIIELNNEEMH